MAEMLFHEKLYGDALPLYSELLETPLEDEMRNQLKLRLAACLLEEGKPQAALQSLQELSILNQSPYLMSRAFRQMGKPAEALHLLQQCTPLQSPIIVLEKGFHLMNMGALADAQSTLESIAWDSENPIPYQLAQLLSSKILLIKHQYSGALEKLFQLSERLPHNHSLHIERVYLTAWTFLALQREAEAVRCLESLLPKALHSSHSTWPLPVLRALFTGYLKLALASGFLNDPPPINILSKAESLLQEIRRRGDDEQTSLLMIDFYLIKAKVLSDPEAYAQAQLLLEKAKGGSSKEEILLKRAAAAPVFEERSRLYHSLTSQNTYPAAFLARAFFLQGLNDFEEGVRCQRQQRSGQSTLSFERAAQAFEQAAKWGREASSFQTVARNEMMKVAAKSLKYQALSYAHLPKKSDGEKASLILLELIGDKNLISSFEQPEEIYYLSAWLSLRTADVDALKRNKELMKQSALSPSWKERCLKLEGMICLGLGQWQEADSLFSQLLEEKSSAASHGEAWFWRAFAADKLHNDTLKSEYLKNSYLQYPDSPYAPAAYFHLYSYSEYMHGKRKAIKHLQKMPLLFTGQPLLICAHRLLGLYHKKDHLNEEGKLLRSKDWTASIDAFQKAEALYDALVERGLIPSAELPYYTHLRYDAQLERAKANFAIAQSAAGGKKQIYLEYAEKVFKDLKEHYIVEKGSYPPLLAEADFELSRIYKEKKEWAEAESVLNASLENYRLSNTEGGLRVMRIWYAKGELYQSLNKYQDALTAFLEAEKSRMGLSPNEKLDLWIQQSLCYKDLGQLDAAMKLLSLVINDDVISPLRIKAMVMRAEIYELQGRPELAIKQLEAAARKGGEWSQKAQEKLERIYGF